MKSENILTTFLAVGLIILLCIAIYKQINEHYSQNDPVLNRIREKLTVFFNTHGQWKGMLTPLNSRDIMSETNIYRGDKSYTINKQKVYICMKDENGKYYDENFLTYVVLHEFSHTICDEVGHTEKFYSIFQNLLEEAVKSGLYDPTKPIITQYCESGDPEMKGPFF